MIRIFKMNDCDWMAGESLEACKQEYLADYYGGRDQDEAFDNPCELSDEQMGRLEFHDPDNGERRSFREELQRLIDSHAAFPAFFATTEF